MFGTTEVEFEPGQKWTVHLRALVYEQEHPELVFIARYHDLWPIAFVTDREHFFATLREELTAETGWVPHTTRDWQLDSLAGRIWMFDLPDERLRGEVRVLLRGRRVYLLLALTPAAAGKKMAEQFFDSFELLPFRQVAYRATAPPGADFRIHAPAGRSQVLFTPLTPEDDYPRVEERLWGWLDTLSGTAYVVARHEIAPFYRHDTLTEGSFPCAFFEKVAGGAVWEKAHVADTIFQGRSSCFHTVGAPSGGRIDGVVFADGRHLYQLFVHWTEKDVTPAESWRWFHSFGLERASDPDHLLRSHVGAMIEVIQRGDTSLWPYVIGAFDYVYFSQEEIWRMLPVLETLDLSTDTTEAYEIYWRVLREVAYQPSREMVAWVVDFFPKVGPASLRASILEVLAWCGLDEARDAYFRLGRSFERDEVNLSDFSFLLEPFKDSLSLMHRYYRHFLDWRDNPTMRYYAYEVLDYWLIHDPEAFGKLAPLQDTFLMDARRLVARYHLLDYRDTLPWFDEYDTFQTLISILGYLPTTPDVVRFLDTLLQLPDPHLLARVVHALYQHDQQVARAVLDFIHESPPAWWALLYLTHQTAHFGALPKEYTSQEEVVRGYSWYRIEELEPVFVSSLRVVERRPVSWQGETWQMYVLDFEVEGFDATFLALCFQPLWEDAVDIEPVFFDYSSTPVSPDNREALIEELLRAAH